MKAVSPVVATVLLIGLAVVGVVLAGYYFLAVVKQSAPKGAVLTVSDARLIYISEEPPGQRIYVLTASIVNTGSEPALITKIELLAGLSAHWDNTTSIMVKPGGVYENTWIFKKPAVFKPGEYYTLRVVFYDSHGEKSIGVPVLCEAP